MAKETFKWSARVGATGKVKPRSKVVAFGDGYEQRAKDGINNDLRTYSVSFNGYKSRVQEIQAFLTRHDGVVSFHWQAPDRLEPRLYVCEEWTDTYHNGLIWELSATFREVLA